MGPRCRHQRMGHWQEVSAMRSDFAALRRIRAVRSGVTFLEVVLAMALLGLAAATLASVVGFVSGMQRRQDASLGSAEIANRVILQYLLDPEKLPARGLPIEYQGDDYHWDIEVSLIEYEVSPEIAIELEERGPNRSSGAMSIEQRLERVAVTAWLSEDSGGSRAKDTGAPQYSIVRVVDRLNLGRNPSIVRDLRDQGEAGLQRLIQMVTNGTTLPAPASSGTTGEQR